jgi:hypothetical protein
MSEALETEMWSRVDLNSQILFWSARRQLIVQFIVCELNFPLKSPPPVAKIDGLRNVLVNDQPFAAGVSHSRRSANHFGGAGGP